MKNFNFTNGSSSLERFLIILADDCCPETISHDGHETECLFLSTANVLASNSDEAMVVASNAVLDGHHRPVAAFTVEDLKSMADALERSPLNAHRRGTYHISGYATAEEIERVAAADNGEASILEA